jgi:L-fuconolactonase
MHVALAAAEAGLNLMIYLPDDMLGGVPLIRRLARDASDRSVVVSHLGAPRVSASTLVEGLELLDLATEPNILVTLSGLSMYTPHPHLEMTGLVTAAIEQFGSGRVMWGSNFPVCVEAESYGHDLALILEGQWGLDDSAIADIIGGSASRVWFDSP